MLLHLVDFGGAQIRAHSGRSLIRSLITAGYLAIGIILLVYGYSEQQQTLRIAGIAVLSIGARGAQALPGHRRHADRGAAQCRPGLRRIARNPPCGP